MEYVAVTGRGSTRDAALAHADKQASQWFGVGAKHLTRRIGAVRPVLHDMNGQIREWSVEVDYENQEGETP